MATTIRLARGGSKARPFYRIVVADSRSPRDGRFIERVGSYDPMLPKDHEKRVVINDVDRVKYWLSCGAQATDRVHRMLANIQDADGKPVMAARSVPAQTKKQLKSQKTLDREQEKADKIQAAKDAAEAAKADAGA